MKYMAWRTKSYHPERDKILDEYDHIIKEQEKKLANIIASKTIRKFLESNIADEELSRLQEEYQETLTKHQNEIEKMQRAVYYHLTNLDARGTRVRD